MPSDAELSESLEDQITDIATNPQQVTIRGRTVIRASQSIGPMVDAMIKLRGLSSPNRGVSVGRIDNAG